MTAPSADARRERAAADAAHWVERLESGKLTTADHEQFVNWLRESPVHVAEALRMMQLVSVLADFRRWSSIPAVEVMPADTVVNLTAARTVNQARRLNPIQKWARVAAVFAGIALCAASATWLKQNLSETRVHTYAGERREITLGDGSVVRMSPNTDLRVDLQRHLRSVGLERGEAVFHVAKDPTRPFVVSAARASVQAVGTVFTVARNADTVVVTVTEGRVSVVARSVDTGTGGGTLPHTPIPLQANERLSISPVGIASPVRYIVKANTPDWEDNQLVFENARVSDIVEKFNRRNTTQIRITDPRLGSRSVSGVFDADDPRSFVDFLTTVAGDARAEDAPDQIIVLPGSSDSSTRSLRP
jgi:transmembrane sensor